MFLLANLESLQEHIELALRKHAGVPFDAAALRKWEEMDACQYAVVGSDALIEVSGPTSYKPSMWAWYYGGCSYLGLQARMEAAIKDETVTRLVLVFDTPGGQVTGLAECAAFVKNCGKPTVALVDPQCASAGLYIASQCNRIVSIPSGEIGSLGTQGTFVSYAEMYKKMGLDIYILRADISPDKNALHPYEPLNKAGLKDMQARIDKMGEAFVAAVAEGRKTDRAGVLANFGQGRMLDADEALKVGLIDEIGTMKSVLAESVSVAKDSRRKNSARFQGRYLSR